MTSQYTITTLPLPEIRECRCRPVLSNPTDRTSSGTLPAVWRVASQTSAYRVIFCTHWSQPLLYDYLSEFFILSNVINSLSWVLPASKVSYLDTKEEDSGPKKPLYHRSRRNVKRQTFPKSVGSEKRECTCVGVQGQRLWRKQEGPLILPTWEDREQRAKSRATPLPAAATGCDLQDGNRCLAVKTRAADSPRPEPGGSAGQKTPRPTLHWFLTHWKSSFTSLCFRKLALESF